MSEDRRFITTRGIIITGWVLLLFVGLAVVGTNLYMWFALGFLFGTFISLVKEFMTEESS